MGEGSGLCQRGCSSSEQHILTQLCSKRKQEEVMMREETENRKR
jgi:hypothetical protein